MGFLSGPRRAPASGEGAALPAPPVRTAEPVWSPSDIHESEHDNTVRVNSDFTRQAVRPARTSSQTRALGSRSNTGLISPEATLRRAANLFAEVERRTSRAEKGIKVRKERDYAQIMEMVSRTARSIPEDQHAKFLAAQGIKRRGATTNVYQPFLKLIVRLAVGGNPDLEESKAAWVTMVAQMCHGLIEGGHIAMDENRIPAPGSFIQCLNEPDRAGRTGWAKGIAAYTHCVLPRCSISAGRRHDPFPPQISERASLEGGHALTHEWPFQERFRVDAEQCSGHGVGYPGDFWDAVYRLQRSSVCCRFQAGVALKNPPRVRHGVIES